MKQTMQRRYELVCDVLRSNIKTGRLPPGFVLLEGPIADLMQSSRAPVQTALKILEEEGVVRRFPGRGFVVVGANLLTKQDFSQPHNIYPVRS